MTVGTQAAVLAGLDVTMFIEFTPSPNSVWVRNQKRVSRYTLVSYTAASHDLHCNQGEGLSLLPRVLKFLYYVMIVSAFCANMIVVSHTTTLSVLGAGLALRGPDGSMVTATDGLYEERRSVFYSFGVGLACTVGSLLMCVWLVLHWEAALVCMVVTLYTCVKIYGNYRRVVRRFGFDESETVNFDDIFHGPAAIQVVRTGLRSLTNTFSGRNNKSKNTHQGTFVSDGDEENDDDSDNSPLVPEKSTNNARSKRRGVGKGENFV